MKVEQIYTGCLAQGAYYIESEGEAAIIDPLREVQPYLQMAERRNATIKYVFETHFHADFVSGHIDLAQKTGATIVYGQTDMKLGFDATIASDGQEFKIGKATIRVIHTPGHTLESSCYLLIDETGKEQAIFTGDTLFIGDVGRPDLAQKVIADLTQDKLAGMLYDSLRNKIMTLPDHLVVYPAHGAGSACGKMMSKETQDTLGNQKATNYALRANMTKEEFIQELLTGLTPPPSYFPQNVLLNINGYDSLDTVMERGTKALSPAEFEAVASETRAVILDTRAPQDFVKGFIPNAINIGLGGSFAVWVGTLIPDVKQEILLIAEEGKEEEAVTRLARVGYDFAIGYLKGGFEAWKQAGFETDSIESVSVDVLAEAMQAGKANVLDVRKASEYNAEHIENATLAPLDYINESMLKVDKNKTYFVHCAGGYRSVVFTSILRARGYNNLIDVQGGFKAIKDSAKFTITDYVPQTTAL
jgi:glyoxylase-like metal-dependent hydrolase (beta-lactamase superfamily II)/rhodanese-related sulfurtransferase